MTLPHAAYIIIAMGTDSFSPTRGLTENVLSVIV